MVLAKWALHFAAGGETILIEGLGTPVLYTQ